MTRLFYTSSSLVYFLISFLVHSFILVHKSGLGGWKYEPRFVAVWANADGQNFVPFFFSKYPLLAFKSMGGRFPGKVMSGTVRCASYTGSSVCVGNAVCTGPGVLACRYCNCRCLNSLTCLCSFRHSSPTYLVTVVPVSQLNIAQQSPAHIGSTSTGTWT